MVEAVKAGFDAEIARVNPDAAIAWVDAEGDRIVELAIEAGLDMEVARKDRLAAVRWHEERGGGDGLEPAWRR